MKSLITGGAGFIGSHLAENLKSLGRDVTVIDDLSTGRRRNIESLESQTGFRFVEGGIFDEKLMRELMDDCDEVYHLAAAVGVRLIVERPVQTIETNIHGTEMVLKLATERAQSGGGFPRILITSTSEVYGKGAGCPLREDDDMILGPTSRSRWCYAASKAIDEFLALAYHEKIDLPVVIARLFNTVGPRQIGQYGMVLPRFVQQALAGEPITVYGDGRMVRCFMHVSDAVEALIALNSHNNSVGEVYNVGGCEPVTIAELAERVRERAQSGSPIQYIPYEKAYRSGFEDIRHRVPDSTKFHGLTGIAPKRDLDEIVDSVIDYYRREDGRE